ncbi:glutathione S-transferase T1 [Artemisia annua]|uniref:Glutathione S-transferase T1 n=1 Tax=Artemisia annua TaxID=35608 RepID=A0A2U1KTM9_ARTAN|nr:glutathione S-transferase T1 [Artemisia annua]
MIRWRVRTGFHTGIRVASYRHWYSGHSTVSGHAILIYLSCAFLGVPSHWYPSDLSKRSKLHSVLDWHHTNLHRGLGDNYI